MTTKRKTANDGDLTGASFGHWKVIESAGLSRYKQRLWLCRCVCGLERNQPTGRLQAGASLSCGCVRRTSLRTTRPDFRPRTPAESYADDLPDEFERYARKSYE